MTFAPVILRELRAEARRPFTYWLRVLGAVALFLALLLAMETAETHAQSLREVQRALARAGRMGFAAPPPTGAPLPPPFAAFGSALFGYCNAMIFLALWVVVPLLMADTLSRERREGTLGLLFLTPLTAPAVVLGKSVAHGLRALTLFLTMLPLLAVPLLLGGVGVDDLHMALLLNSAALLLALSAGLLASCLSRDRLKAVFLAEAFSFVLALALMNAHDKVFQRAASNAPPAGWAAGGPRPWPLIARPAPSSPFYADAHRGEGFPTWLQRMIRQTTNLHEADSGFTPWGGPTPGFPGGIWRTAWTNFPASMHAQWFSGVRGLLALAFLWLGLAVALAAYHVRRVWREAGPSPQAERLRQTYCTPRVAPGFLRWRLKRALGRNPIGWLAQYSWKARLTKWGWCLGLVVAEGAFSGDLDDLAVGQRYLGLLLLAGVALNAALGFRREVELRLMELLLVTPLKPAQLLRGRIGAIWAQFLPSVAVLALANYFVWTYDRRVAVGFFATGLEFAVTFGVLPVFGLYFSLFRWNLAAAWLATCACGLAAPHLASLLARFGLYLGLGIYLHPMAIQLALAAGAWLLAIRRLKRRQLAAPGG